MAVLFFAVAAQAAPAAEADAEADPQYLAAHPLAAAPLAAAPLAAAPAVAAVAAAPAVAPVAYHAPAPNCRVENEILVTQTCTPTAENVCTTEVVDTEEIEYVKVCKDVVDTLCDAPATYAAHHVIAKREADAEADAEADPQFYAPYAAAPVAAAAVHAAAPIAHVAPVATAVAHSAVATVKHACREVTTQHCVDNPQVKIVPVEVEHCHTVTKVACADVENPIPKTTCEAVETTHTYAVPHAGYVAAAPAW